MTARGIDADKRFERKKKGYIITGFILWIAASLYILHFYSVKIENPRYDISKLILEGMKHIFLHPLDIYLNSTTLMFVALAGAVVFIMISPLCVRRAYDLNPYGEARFMNKADEDAYNMKRTEPFGEIEKNGKGNMILSRGIFLSMDGFTSRRNCNVLIIGGSGAGKSRFFASPNILQYNANFIITDPSGELRDDYAKGLEDNGYKVKCFDLTNVYTSNKYNPFNYIKTEKDVFILVNTQIQNTTPPGKNGGDPFWENSEKLLLTALILYIWHTEKDPAKRTFSQVLRLLDMANIDENGDDTESPLDIMFAQLEKKNPKNLAVKQYKKFKLGGAKTLKSILISVGVRLENFDLEDIAYLTSEDELDFDHFADSKQALFVVIPTADKTFNFIVSLMYSQLFMSLYNYVETRAKFGWEAVTADGEIVKVSQAPSATKSAVAKKDIEAFIDEIKKGVVIEKDGLKKLYKVRTRPQAKKVKVAKAEYLSIKKQYKSDLNSADNKIKAAAEEAISQAEKKYRHIEEKEIVGWRGSKKMVDEYVERLKTLKLQNCPRRCPNHVRFILDEFANIGQIPDFNEKVATIRKYSISVSIIIQALSQLKTLYKDDWNTLVGNCDTKLFLGSDDSDTIEWLVKILGKQTVTARNHSNSSNSSSESFNQTGADLIPADAVSRMPDTHCIVKVRGHFAWYGSKYELTMHPNYSYAHKVADRFVFIADTPPTIDKRPEHEKTKEDNDIEKMASSAESEDVTEGKSNNSYTDKRKTGNKKPLYKKSKKNEIRSNKNKLRKEKADKNLSAAKELEDEKNLSDAQDTATQTLLDSFGITSNDTEETIKEKINTVIQLEDPPMDTFLWSQTE